MQIISNMHLSIDGWPIAAVCLMVILDIVTGLMKAFATGTVQSSVMREGLFHKATYFILILLFAVVEVLQMHFDILPELPTALAICVYVVATEIISIIENISIINPELTQWPIIKQVIASLKSGGSDD